MIKLIAFLIISGLSVGMLYLSYLYVTGKKFAKFTPKATFLNGPLEGQELIVGPFSDTIVIRFPSIPTLYGIYDHIGDGFYNYRSELWEHELDQLELDKSTVIDYNTVGTEQEETDDTTDNSRQSNTENHIG